jgi:leader peptidase (prepilin peptidase) / N-methyltransferase
MSVAGIILFGVLGLAVGSFLNVCIDRLPRKESILRPPSHCDTCGRRLGVKDLIPLFSYVRLHGRCRYCGAPVPRRVFWVELATGVIFGLLYWHIGLTPELGVIAFYACLFIIVFVVDLEHGLILNRVVYTGMAVALLLAIFLPPSWLTVWIEPGVASAAIGGAIGFVVFLLIVILSKGGMGWGDVKLAALIGLAGGFPLVVACLIVAAILGGVVAVVLLASKKRGRREAIPFGPFLSLATFITLLWSNEILRWYMGFG